MDVSLLDVAKRAGVSVKTASGALHGGSPRLSAETRRRVRGVADELGYVTNIAARGVRQGWLPIVGVVADGLITSPFATDLMRALDNALRQADGTAAIVTSVGGRRGQRAGSEAEDGVVIGVLELARFRPRAMAYAAMYHKVVALPPDAATRLRVLLNCREEGEAAGRVPSLVPAEAAAASELARHLFGRGRRRIAFLTLPGLVAGALREDGLRLAHAEAGLAPLPAERVRPASRGPVYSGFPRRSLVAEQVAALMGLGRQAPDAIICGNDRIALETYGALARLGARVPDDVAVAGFDNQVEIAGRLDPPLTTMALPFKAMGRRGAEILLGGEASRGVEEIPFRLVARGST